MLQNFLWIWYEFSLRLNIKISTTKTICMNKKIVTGAIIAIAAGLATYFYRKRRNKLSTVASDTYNTMDNTLRSVEDKTENFF